ncbi:hypothetical protein KH5H1_25380 [Corallococcus caeni]|nr:hypothetical protein KH5H1_25380 [Corallococcus sp. KH5-1]
MGSGATGRAAPWTEKKGWRIGIILTTWERRSSTSRARALRQALLQPASQGPAHRPSRTHRARRDAPGPAGLGKAGFYPQGLTTPAAESDVGWRNAGVRYPATGTAARMARPAWKRAASRA